MVSTDSGSKWRKIIIIGVVVFFVIILLITWLVGIQSLKSFFKWLIGIVLVCSILFGLAYMFWLMFVKKEYKDIPATYKKKLIQTAKLMRNNMLGSLYLSGDKKHNRIRLGKYAYMRITLPKHVMDKPTKDGDNKKPEYTEPIPVDCFIIFKQGMIDTLFNEPIFVLAKPEDHDYSSIFNNVTLNAFNLVPLDSQFYTINTRNLDVDIIKGMATNYIREVVYEIFRDLDKLVKQAMNLDQHFQKEKQKGLLSTFEQQ